MFLLNYSNKCSWLFHAFRAQISFDSRCLTIQVVQAWSSLIPRNTDDLVHINPCWSTLEGLTLHLLERSGKVKPLCLSKVSLPDPLRCQCTKALDLFILLQMTHSPSSRLIQVEFCLFFVFFWVFFASIELVIYIFELYIIKNSNEQIQ